MEPDEKKTPWGWIVAGAAAIGLGLYLAFKGDDSTVTTGERKWTPQDIDWLRRMLVLEVGDIDPGPEWAGVAYVAVNRAIKGNKSIEAVVHANAWIGSGPDATDYLGIMGANQGKSPKGRPAPPIHPRWGISEAFAKGVLAGTVPNPIGKRTSYVHYRSLKPANGKPPGDFMDFQGKRAPKWVVPKSAGGLAVNDPLTVGRATFV